MLPTRLRAVLSFILLTASACVRSGVGGVSLPGPDSGEVACTGAEAGACLREDSGACPRGDAGACSREDVGTCLREDAGVTSAEACDSYADEADHRLMGLGTSDAPYVLCGAWQLASLAASPADHAAHYLLGADLDLGAYYAGGGAEFRIGTCGVDRCDDGDEAPFTGTLRGDGHKISGFRWADQARPGGGLFAALRSAVVTDLVLEEVDVDASDVSGGLAGQVEDSSVTNVQVSGVVRSHLTDGGGIAGVLASGVISDTSFVGTIACWDRRCGGIAGSLAGSAVRTSSDVVVEPDLPWTHSGGVAGWVASTGLIDRAVASASSVSQSRRMGGLAGVNEGTIRASTVEQMVLSDATDSHHGGAVGENLGLIEDVIVRQVAISGRYRHYGGVVGHNGATGVVRRSRSRGTIYSTYNRIGGVAGTNLGLIEQCLSEVKVAGPYWGGGGLVGDNHGTISDSLARGDIVECSWFDSIVSDEGDCGGFAASNEATGRIERCYTLDHTYSYPWETGGFVGRNEGVIEHSFVAGAWIRGFNSAATVGEFVGVNIGTMTEVYYEVFICDADRTTQATEPCNGLGTAAPDQAYFHDPANPPFAGSWDDTAVWEFDGAGFPTLRNLPQ